MTMAVKEKDKIESDIEEIRKQIWLLTLKFKNLQESNRKSGKNPATEASAGNSLKDQANSKPETKRK